MDWFLLKLATVRIFVIDSDAIFVAAAIASFSLIVDLARYLKEMRDLAFGRNILTIEFKISMKLPSFQNNSNEQYWYGR